MTPAEGALPSADGQTPASRGVGGGFASDPRETTRAAAPYKPSRSRTARATASKKTKTKAKAKASEQDDQDEHARVVRVEQEGQRQEQRGGFEGEEPKMCARSESLGEVEHGERQQCDESPTSIVAPSACERSVAPSIRELDDERAADGSAANSPKKFDLQKTYKLRAHINMNVQPCVPPRDDDDDDSTDSVDDDDNDSNDRVDVGSAAADGESFGADVVARPRQPATASHGRAAAPPPPAVSPPSVAATLAKTPPPLAASVTRATKAKAP